MQALSDDQRIGRLEGKVDGLDERVQGLDKKVDRLETKVEGVRSEARADFRTLLAVQMTTIVAMILGFAALLLQHHL